MFNKAVRRCLLFDSIPDQCKTQEMCDLVVLYMFFNVLNTY